MTTRSTGEGTVTPRGRGIGGQVSRGGGRGRGPKRAQVGNQGDNENQNGNIGNDNIQGNVRNVMMNNNPVGCTYMKFLACNPKEYDRNGGAVVYTRWIEKTKSFMDMSGYGDNQKVKYTAGSFVGIDREEFCPSNEMQMLETELCNHAIVGAGHAPYTGRLYELARLVLHFVTL
uniref:Reverse transcriptase domain-containing protein n=1 Tax=Tanacetum cinerariifolium TaxID=118510 RepID=A0A699GKQ2_TANCI|nr:hypothetical protein [Tanacetum cinerariifolium]